MQHHHQRTTTSPNSRNINIDTPKPPGESPLPVLYVEEEEDETARRRRCMENANEQLDEIHQVDDLMPPASPTSTPNIPSNNNQQSENIDNDKSHERLPVPPNGSSYALPENLIPQHAIAIAAINATATASTTSSAAAPSSTTTNLLPPSLQAVLPSGGGASSRASSSMRSSTNRTHGSVPVQLPSGVATGSGTARRKRSHGELLRSRIRAIAKDKTLSAAERDRERQKLFTAGHTSARARERAAYLALCGKRKHVPTQSQHMRVDSAGRAAGRRLPGCVHYPRGNKVRSPCCGMWVVCRRCHDTPCMTADHVIDRFAIERTLCMACGTEQGVRGRCVNTACGRRFARYFCSKCKFWDDTPGKDIYHCDKCGLCRVGKGLGHDNYHCDKCNACVSLERDSDGKISHHCQETSLDADCPICGTHMLTSTTQVVFMQCGHAMHLTCFDKYTATNYVCPICNMALTDMSPHYRQIDQVIADQPLPKEFQNRKVEIRCHDCDVRSITKFHFIYLKCIKCNGYNTRLIDERDPNDQVRVLESHTND